MAGDVLTGGEPAARRHRLPGLVGPVALAVAADFALDTLVSGRGRGLVLGARVAGFLLGALVAVALGWYLGAYSWPHQGRRMSAYLLRRALRSSARRPKVFLTDRADFTPSLARRVLEVVGFAAGSSVIVAVALTIVGASAELVAVLVQSLFTLVALWASFVLVPYWAFGRMGLRAVDRERWLVQPMGRRYADRLRLSNGALLLIAFGAVVNLAFRAGRAPDAAVLDGIVTVGRIIAAVLVTAASAVAFYLRREPALVADLEAEALRDGAIDGRGLTDEQFLPAQE